MEISDFRKKVKQGSIVSVEGSNFNVREVVKFRLDDGSYYIKCFLNDGFVLADDENANAFLLVQKTETKFEEQFPNELSFQEKKFKFLYSAHAVAEQIKGEEIFKKGESERFWDYKADDNSYLSLGVIDKTGKRMDLYGKIVKCKNVMIA
jgi:hypothetical protein